LSGRKIEIVKASRNRLEFKLRGEDHTMANLIVKLAIKKPHVTYAAYKVEHPLIGGLTVVLATDGTITPIEVLRDVLNDIIRLSEEFRKALEEA